MSDPPNVIAICGDPGGAAAVGPVITRLRAEGKVMVHALAYLQARDVWSAQSIAFESVDGTLSFDDIRKHLCRPNTALLCGTSVNAFDLEKRFIAATRQLGTPSLAVLDFWSNYARRFSDDQGKLEFLPDRIAVMDRLARDEMIAEGIDPSIIVITGHPGFDGLTAYRAGFSKERRLAIRQRFGVDEEELLVLFASQPPSFFSDTVVPGLTPPWLNRDNVLRLLGGALAEIAIRTGQRIALVIRPHPREASEAFHRLDCDPVRVLLQRGEEPKAAIMAADLVVGMSTMLMVEACQMSKPVISIRLGFPLPDDFPPNRLGLASPVYDEGLIAPILTEKILALPADVSQVSNGKSMQTCRDATGNVAREIYQLLNMSH